MLSPEVILATEFYAGITVELQLGNISGIFRNANGLVNIGVDATPWRPYDCLEMTFTCVVGTPGRASINPCCEIQHGCAMVSKFEVFCICC
jgi:hypothetical protein